MIRGGVCVARYGEVSNVRNKAWNPFIAGAIAGSLAGAIAGTLLSQHTVHLIGAFVGLVDRRLSQAEREKVRFDLMLQ
jgi:uncharacterized membrane protein YfcA